VRCAAGRAGNQAAGTFPTLHIAPHLEAFTLGTAQHLPSWLCRLSERPLESKFGDAAFSQSEVRDTAAHAMLTRTGPARKEDISRSCVFRPSARQTSHDFVPYGRFKRVSLFV
jgi:hypothetical protein